jgi:hypothetical protein
MDVFMAVFMAEKVASEHFSRPFARNLDGDLHPICYPRSYSTAKKLASLVYKELYPGNSRRFSHVDGDVTNLCNWNIVPKPYVSHVNMVRRDGHTWYIKLEDHKGNYRIEAGSEEALLAIMKYRRDEFRGMLLDVSPRDLGHSLHGNDISMVTWYGHLDRMKAWSPTGDLEPYCQPLA